MNRGRFRVRFFAATLFIGTTVFLLHQSQNQSPTFDSPTTTKQLIDNELKQIPICNAADRPRQRALLLTLRAWSELTRQSNLHYWLSFGTLVGYVQKGGLLPYSVDLSVNLLAQDTARLITLSKTNFSTEYELKVHPDWSLIEYIDRKYYPKSGIRFVAPNAQFINRKEDVHIDIYPSYDYDPSVSKKLMRNELVSTNLTEYDPDYDWISYPRNWTFPLQVCYFSGVKTLCPAEPKTLVTAMYGQEALNRTYTICVNGTWVESDTFQ